jgi:hypothetical protein
MGMPFWFTAWALNVCGWLDESAAVEGVSVTDAIAFTL